MIAKKQTAAMKYNSNNYHSKIALGVLKQPDFKPLALDRATLAAFERAAEPYRRFSGDGR